MCTNKKIDGVLKKLEICQDTKEMRQIIEKADLCHECPEVLQTFGDQEADCSCRQRFRVKLKNLINSEY